MNITLTLDKERLLFLTQKYPISLIILFGSLAKGIPRENSDIDLGVVLEKPIADEQESELLMDFVDLLKTDSLDIAILNYASPLLLFQAAKSGIPIFERNKGIFKQFKLRAFKQYWETKKFRDMKKNYLNKLISRV